MTSTVYRESVLFVIMMLYTVVRFIIPYHQVETGDISTRCRILKIVYKITSILGTLCTYVNTTQYFKIVKAIIIFLIC